jgi:hypothetical protein
MFQMRKYNMVFHLARILKDRVAAGKSFDKDFSILPLYGDSAAICKPQDIPNLQDQLEKVYSHHIGNINISGCMKIRSRSIIAQLKHQYSSFKQYLLHKRVNINNAQLGPEEGIVTGWLIGSHPAFIHRDDMIEELSAMMGKEVEGLKWAIYPNTIYFMRKSENVKLATQE